MEYYVGEFAIALGGVFVAVGVYRIVAHRSPKPKLGFVGAGLLIMVAGLVVVLSH